MGISPKVNAIPQLDFKIAYYDVTVKNNKYNAVVIPHIYVI